MKKLLYIAFFLTYIVAPLHGQITLEYQGSPGALAIVEKYQSLRQDFGDSLKAEESVDQLLSKLHAEGYLLAVSKRPPLTENKMLVHIEPGIRYEWASLHMGSMPEILLSKIGYRERFYRAKPFKYSEVAKLFEKALKVSENAGYPFATIGMDSLTIDQGIVEANLSYTPGPLITYDSLIIIGTDNVKRTWLSAYLNLRPGDPFDQSEVDKIIARVEALGFLQVSAPLSITFQNSEATITLQVKETNANRIDGIVGFLPNAQQNGKLLVTGQFDLALANLFSSGKKFTAQWQRLKPLSQYLSLSYNHTSLLHSPVDLDMNFELLKEDTTFINRNAYLGLSYLRKYQRISFFTHLRRSRLLSVSQYSDASQLPELNDFNINYYGVGYVIDNFNPRIPLKRGQELGLEVSVGTKEIKPLAAIPQELYDNVDLRTLQYQLLASYQYFLPVSKNFVIHQRLKGGNIFSKNLLKNDLFRLGGLRSLRGFNENFFFADDYLLSNLELQLHFDAGSYLFLFYDQAYLYYNVRDQVYVDYPLGLGAGLNMVTGSGIISLAYAAGQSADQPLSLRLSKFHFGYVAKF